MGHETRTESKKGCDGTEAKMQQENLSRNQSADMLKGRIQMQKTRSIAQKTQGGKVKHNLIHWDIFELLPTQMLSARRRYRLVLRVGLRG